MKHYNITPVAKPRMTRRDVWSKRSCVLKYRAYCDELRLNGVTLDENGFWIKFVLPMPKSWSKRKRAEMEGKPHTPKPDKDNLEKGISDALYQDDAHLWRGGCEKVWGEEGAIIVSSLYEYVKSLSLSHSPS